MPMPAMVMRSEGGVAPPSPKADDGTMYGAATAAAALPKNFLRESFPLIPWSSSDFSSGLGMTIRP
jgi:hypothetical protein